MSNKSQIAEQALQYIAQLYTAEREVKNLHADERLQIRQIHSKPLADAMHEWMRLQRQKITDGSATDKAGLHAPTRFLDDGQLPIDNNWIENQIRPIAIGHETTGCLRARSEPVSVRLAAVMSLIKSTRLNGHDPYAYLKDVLQRLPTHKNNQIAELLPHRWQAALA